VAEEEMGREDYTNCMLYEIVKNLQRKLVQYSLLESFNHNPSKLLYNRWTTYFMDEPIKGQKESSRIKLPVELKKGIVLSLRNNGQRLSNGRLLCSEMG
jgi:hypothetical protein